jgi:hypothetical protein
MWRSLRHRATPGHPATRIDASITQQSSVELGSSVSIRALSSASFAARSAVLPEANLKLSRRMATRIGNVDRRRPLARSLRRDDCDVRPGRVPPSEGAAHANRCDK